MLTFKSENAILYVYHSLAALFLHIGNDPVCIHAIGQIRENSAGLVLKIKREVGIDLGETG